MRNCFGSITRFNAPGTGGTHGLRDCSYINPLKQHRNGNVAAHKHVYFQTVKVRTSAANRSAWFASVTSQKSLVVLL